MDYSDFEIVASHDSVVSHTEVQFESANHTDDVWQGAKFSALPRSEDLARRIRLEVEEAFKSPEPLFFIVSPDLVEVCGNEVKRFICALYAYINSPNPVLSLTYLVDRIIDLDAAKELKNLRSAALLNFCRGDFDAPNEKVTSLPRHHINDIGDIFNYKYWLHWEEPIAGDLEYTQIPVPEVSDEKKKLFKESCIELLEHVRDNFPVPVVDEDEILFSLSSSSCIRKDGKKGKVWKEKEENNTFSSSPLNGYVTIIQKSPTEVREAITLTIDQSNSIKLIEKQSYHILKNMQYSAYHADPDVFEERRAEFNENRFFLNRDLEKEGLSKPRYLMKIMGEALKEVFPDMPAWKYLGVYDDLFLIYPDGSKRSTLRGNGLGMTNALTTFLQCAMFHTFIGVMEDVPNDSIEALFFNDDGTIGSSDEDNITAYTSEEADFLRSYGLMPKGSKTWYGEVSVLCERYFPANLNVKASYKAYAQVIPFAATNIVAAKAQCSLLLDPTYGGPNIELFKKLVEFWGYEFDRLETSWPATLGGWFNFKVNRVDCSFINEGEEPPYYADRGAFIGPPKIKPRYFTREGPGMYLSPAEKVYRVPDMPPIVESSLNVRQERRRISALFHRNSSRDVYEEWLRRERSRRQACWLDKPERLGWENIFRILNNQEDVDILPPISLMKTKQAEEVAVRGSRNLEFPNPFLSVVKFWSENITDYNKNIPWPVMAGDTFNQDVTGRKIARANNFWENIPGGSFNRTVLDSRQWVLARRDWSDSYNVWEVWSWLTRQREYPIPPWVLGRAKIHKEFEDYEFHVEWNHGIYNVAPQIGWTTCRAMVCNPELIDKLLEPVVEEKQVEKRKETLDPPSFDEWYGTGKPVFKHPLYEVYTDAIEALSISSIIESLGSLSENRRTTDMIPKLDLAKGKDRIFEVICNLECFELHGHKLVRQKRIDFFSEDLDDTFGGLFDPG